MSSHKELLQRRLDAAERAYRDAANETERLDVLLKAERTIISELDAKYEAACRQVATGAAGDPALSLVERDRRSHRLRGLEALYREAAGAIAPLHDERQAAGAAMQEELDREERLRLESALDDANRKRDEAKTAYDTAQQAVNDAVWARSRWLRQLELNARQRA